MIEVRDLVRSHGAHRVLDGVSFAVETGSCVGFLGPNGAGKTTTLRILAGLLAPESGSVRLGCAVEPRWEAENRWDSEVRSRIGYLPENPPVYRNLSVEGHLRLLGELHGLSRADLDAAIERMARAFDLSGWMSKLAGNLSKGTRQRLGLAATFLHEPEIVLLDEPYSGLDPEQRQLLSSFLRKGAKRRTVLFSSHSLPDMEGLVDRVLVLKAGRIAHETTASSTRQAEIELRVRRRDEQLVAELHALEAVLSVIAAEEAGVLRITTDSPDEARECIAEVCVRLQAGLLEMREVTEVQRAHRVLSGNRKG